MMALRATSILFVGLLLAGCQTDGAALPSVACTVFKPITYSTSKDTRETVRQVVGHNATGKSLCGWKPAK